MLKIESTGPSGPAPISLSEGDRTLFRLAAAYVVIVAGFLIVWLAAKPGSHQVFLDVSSAVRFLGPLGLVPFYLVGIRRAGVAFGPWLGERRSWAPIAMGASTVCFAVGRGIAGVYDIFMGQTTPFPSVADAAWLASYPLLLAGILLLPNRSISVSAATRVLLDVLLVLTGIAGYSWYFVLGPGILAEHASVLARIVSVAYPIADLSLIGSMLLLGTLFPRNLLHRVVPLLGLGLFALIGADSLREYQLLHNAYTPGTLLDFGRPLGYMLIGLAAIATRLLGAAEPEAGTGELPAMPRKSARPIPRVWRYLLPYSSVPAVVALMIFAARTPGHPPLAAGVYAVGAVLIELVFLHQFLDYRELIAFSNRNARLESLAAADPVTGLPNHRTVVSALDLEFERARRYHHPCTALFLDLDHFKALNDSYGHPSGDSALREFASVVRTALRGIDILGRWGGEEFVAMLPETDLQEAVSVAERVRAAVAAHTFWSAGGAHLTCSIGVASYPEDAENRDELIEMADRAMYAAKGLGRNQVRTASDPAVAALEANARSASVREEAALLGTVEALAAVVEARDHSTGKHVAEVASLATRLALHLGLDTSEAHTVGLAGRLHDIGKVSIPDSVLNKPGRLTQEEWALVRKHPAVGAAVVSRVPALRVLAPIIRAHHEHWDGSGYPNGLAGDAIPLCARILSVADSYQAMTAERPYRAAMTPQKALTEIQTCAGTQFDPAVVDALRKVLQADDATASVA